MESKKSSRRIKMTKMTLAAIAAALFTAFGAGGLLMPLTARAANYDVAITAVMTTNDVYTAIQAELDTANSGDIVTVTGTHSADSPLFLTIPAGVKVMWKADYSNGASFTQAYMITLSGGGEFEVTSGGKIDNNFNNSNACAVYTSTSDYVNITVSAGGTVTCGYGRAIESRLDGNVTVDGGTVTGGGTEDYSAAVYTDVGKVTVKNGGIVTYNGSEESSAAVYTYSGDIEVNGGFVKAPAAGCGIITEKGSVKILNGAAAEGYNTAVLVEDTSNAPSADRVTVDNSIVKSSDGSAIVLGIQANGNIKVTGSSQVISTSTYDAIFIFDSGGVYVTDSTVKSSGVYTVRAYSGDVFLTGSVVENTCADYGCAVYSGGSITVDGGKVTVTGDNGRAVDAGGNVNVSNYAIIENKGTGTGGGAINAAGNITVTSSTVTTAGGDAISASGKVTLTNSGVYATTGYAVISYTGASISGGFAFAYGYCITGWGYPEFEVILGNYTLSNNAVVVAWDESAGNTNYFVGDSTDLTTEGGAAKWGLDAGSGKSVIRYQNGTNNGLFIVTGVTVNKKTPTAADFNFTIPANHVYTGLPQGIGAVTSKYGGMGTVTVKYNNNTAIPKDAGTYAVTADVPEGDDYLAGSVSLGTYTIAKKEITVTGIDILTRIYDGTDTVYFTGLEFGGLVNGETLTIGSDYSAGTPKYDSPAAGTNKTVSVTVLLQNNPKANNYTLANGGNYTLTGYPIHKMPISINAVTLAAKTYDGTTAAEVSSVSFNNLISPDSLNLGTDFVVPNADFDTPDAGTGKIVTGGIALIPNAKTNNYLLSDGSFTVPGQTIAQATVNGVNQVFYVLAGAGEAKTYDFDLTTLLPGVPGLTNATYAIVTVTNDNGVLENLNPYDYINGTTTLKLNVVANAPNNSAEIKVTISSDNYANFISTIYINPTAKTSLSFTGVTTPNKVYDGSQYAYSGAITVINNETGNPEPGFDSSKYEVRYESVPQGSYGSATPPAKAGAYKMLIQRKSSEQNYMGETSYFFSITPAAVTVKADDKTIMAGDPVPFYNYFVIGLAPSDNLSPGATLDCEYTTQSSPGAYPIVPHGAAVPAGGNYSANIVYVPGTLTVTPRYYTVTASAGQGGSISPSGAVSVVHGGSIAFTITANNGYFVSDVIVDGVSAGVRNTYTFSNVTGNHTIEAAFSKNSTGGSGNNSGGGGGSSSGTTATVPVKLNGQTVNARLGSDGTLTLTYTEADIKKYADNTGKFDITVSGQGSITFNVDIPALGGDDLVIHTDFGTIVIPNATLQALRELYGDTLRMSIVKGSFKVTLFDKNNKEIAYNDPANPFTVTLPYKLQSGQKPGAVVAVDKSGKIFPYGVYNNGSVTFEIAATGVYDVKYNAKAFSDTAGHWAVDYIDFVAARGLFAGDNGQFMPGGSMTRAMFAQVLANLDGVDLSVYKTSRFDDVAVGQWYAAAVEWAAEKGIVSGYGGNFDPNANITREQMAVMLYNYMKYKGYSIPSSGAADFADEDSISSWAYGAVKTIQGMGIVGGRPGNLYDPKSTATRAEVATVFANFVKYIEV